MNKPDLTTAEVERLVKQDVSLSLRVLRSVNSAAYPIRTEVRSIGQALFLLGIEPIRKWASVWCLAGLTTGATPELATLALLRARACEMIGEQLTGVESSELFLVGLFSLLDVMLSRTMAAALEALPLSKTASAALLGEPNALRRVLDAVLSYERGNGMPQLSPWSTRAYRSQRCPMRTRTHSAGCKTSRSRCERRCRADACVAPT